MYDNSNCVPENPRPCVPKEDSFKGTLQETKNVLAELLVMMGDTCMQLFADSPVERTEALEGKCFADDVRTVQNQAKMALSIMNDMRRRMIG
jgi:hypothetical protein